MKRTHTFIPTLIALTAACAASQPVQAQTPARQAFAWSSATANSNASPTVPSNVSHVSDPTLSYHEATAETSNPVGQSVGTTILERSLPESTIDNTIESTVESAFDSSTNIADNAVVVEAPIYLDENGNQITREQMQAKLSAGQNELTTSLPSANEAVQSFGQNLGQNIQQRVTPLQSVDNSAWGKVKNVTSKATSFWKKPSLFKTPEGITLPSTKSTWAKPKFAEPTTWFSQKSVSPITFAPLGSLPRNGKTPTSIEGPVHQTQIASQAPASITSPIQSVAKASQDFVAKPVREVVDTTKSIFKSTGERVASEFSVGNDFDPRR